jgi:hypothetical protein
VQAAWHPEYADPADSKRTHNCLIIVDLQSMAFLFESWAFSPEDGPLARQWQKSPLYRTRNPAGFPVPVPFPAVARDGR